MEKKGICIIGKKGSSEEGRIGFHAWCVAAIAVAVLLDGRNYVPHPAGKGVSGLKK